MVGNLDIDSGPDATEIMAGLFTKEALGDFPYSAGGYENTSEELVLREMMPGDMDIVRYHKAKNAQWLYARNAKTLLYLRWINKGGLTVFVSSQEDGVAQEVVDQITDQVPEAPVLEDDGVMLWLWHHNGMSGNSTSKKIKAPAWTEVERNYAGNAADPLAKTMKVEKPETGGKIILWHGSPGTGKTSAILTLMREWKGWCEFNYISDAEILFRNPSYLMQVATSDDNNFRLVIAEDCDTFLRPDAQNDSNSGLGRLLNFSDGILGQGCNTLFLLTTNIRMDSLHPALTRPGRCFSQVEFPKFTHQEMVDWLPSGVAVPSTQQTLAELIEHLNKKQISNGIATESNVGQYL
jgi:hypothetical protein